MRVFGQMPMESARGDELEELLIEAAESAKQHQWALRREALLSRWTRPAAEDARENERVRALLRWSETSSAERLMALADLRRAKFVSSHSWLYWLWPSTPAMTPSMWLHVTGHAFLIVLVAVPFLTHMDLPESFVLGYRRDVSRHLDGFSDRVGISPIRPGSNLIRQLRSGRCRSKMTWHSFRI
eukprot:g29936.t1